MNQRLLKKACGPGVALTAIILALTVVIVTLTVLTYMNKVHGAEPGTCVFSGEVIPNCLVMTNPEGNEPNIMARWTMPTERASCLEYDLAKVEAMKAAGGETVDVSLACRRWQPLALSEIDKIRIYFVTAENNWSQIDVGDHRTAVVLYKPPGSYEFLGTTFDTDGRESKGSERVAITISDGVREVIEAPKMPRGITITAP